MERITMVYSRNDNDGADSASVEFSKRDTDREGLRCYDICEMFLDFMEAAGFARENILDYFVD